MNLCDDGAALCWNWENEILEAAYVIFVTCTCSYFQHFRNRKYFTFTIISTVDVSPMLYFLQGNFGDAKLRNTKQKGMNFHVPFKRHNLLISAHVPGQKIIRTFMNCNDWIVKIRRNFCQVLNEAPLHKRVYGHSEQLSKKNVKSVGELFYLKKAANC